MTNREILDAYVAAFAAADPEVSRRLIAPGAVIWHNFDDRDRDIAASLGELVKMKERFDDMRMDVLEHFELEDGFGVRLVLRGTVRSTGEPFESHQARFIRIDGGKITRIEEYVAPVDPRS